MSLRSEQRSYRALAPNIWLFLAALSGSLIWYLWKAAAHQNPPISLSLGIAVAGLLLVGMRFWPALAAGALLGAALVEPARPILQSFAHGAGLTLGALVTAALIRRGRVMASALLEPRSIVWVLLAVATGTFVGAVSAAGVALAVGAPGSFEAGLVLRFTRFGLGLIVAAPLVLAWARPAGMPWRAGEWASFMGLMLLCAVMAAFIDFTPQRAIIACVVFPMLTLAALRFGLKGATTSVAIVAVVTLFTSSLSGGSSVADVGDRLHFAEIYVVMTAATMLLLAAIADRSVEIAKRVRAEQRYEAIFDKAGVGVSILSLEGTYLEINDRALAIAGYARDEMLGRPVSQVAMPSDNPHDRDRLQQLARGERPFLSRDLKIRTRDGDVRWVRATSTLVRDAVGAPEHIVSVSEDISDLVKAERALADSENLLRLTQELAGVGVWSVDLATRSSRHSATSAALLGVPWRAGPYRLRDFVPSLGADQITALRLQLVHSAKKGVPFEMPVRVSLQDGGTRWVRLNGSHDPNDGQSRLLGLTVDITGDVESAAELHEAHGKLLRVARLSAMGAMASTLAHELSQPLAAVTNFIEVARFTLRSTPGEASGLNETLDAARDQALRAGRIIQRMRAFTLSGDVMLERVATSQLISAVCDSVSKLPVCEGVSVECPLPAEEMPVLGDPVQLEQVLTILIKNAAEATRGCSPRRVMLSSEVRAHDVVIKVSDTGTGLSDSVLSTLFEPFTSSKAEGMGLGLPICQTIVEAHGGRLWAGNNAAGGATFSLTLPLETSFDLHGAQELGVK